MSRDAWCGYRSTRSPRLLGSLAFRRRLACLMISLTLLLGLPAFLSAQDVKVHIDPPAPKPTPDATSKATDADSDPGLMFNHGKPFQVPVDLVLVPVTVTDDWNRIVT